MTMLFIELNNDADYDTIIINPEYLVSMCFDEERHRTEVTMIDGTYERILDTPDEIITKIKESRLREAFGLK